MKTADTVNTIQGIIYQALSGFYYVWHQGKRYTTKPRGNFRHQGLKPLVGDQVVVEIANHPDEVDRIVEILPRKNQLIRPSVVNVDYAFVVMSLAEPNFSFALLDQFLVSVEHAQIQPIILLTKYDVLQQRDRQLAETLWLDIQSVYQAVGYECVLIDQTPQGIEQLKQHIHSGIYVFMGQSGVGKSTLINRLLPELAIETGEISHYLNRGRHTTREVTLYRMGQGLIADTPGFSALDLEQIDKQYLASYFPEFVRASEACKFRTCLHVNEPVCGVKQAVELGEIAPSRYQNYLQMLERIEQRKPIYRKNK